MPTTEASQRATNKFIKKKYDRINLLLDKGMKELIADHVKQQQGGESVNAFIQRAIKAQLEREI